MGDFDDLLTDFLVESREHLGSIEPDLLEMERSGATTSQDSLHRVFRAIHSIKGACGFFSFTALKRLSHAMENVLMPIRDGVMKINPEIVDALLAGVDTLRTMLDDIESSDNVPCDDIIKRLDEFLAIPQAQPDADSPQIPAAEIVPVVPITGLQLDASYDEHDDAVRAAVAKGMRICRVRVNLLKDLTQKNRTADKFSELVLSLGQVIAFPDDAKHLADRLREDISFSFVMATVLTTDMLGEGLDLAVAQIETIATDAIRQAVLAERQATKPVAGAIQTKPAAAKPAAPATADTHEAASAPAPSGGNAVKHEGPESVRVRVELLARVMNSASELVLARNQLLSLLDNHMRKIPGLLPVLQNLDRTVSELQERAMQTRMQPIDSIFMKVNRMVRDLARQMHKEIELTIEGADVELDKSVIELLGDPLIHLIRNSVDHGIESPDERQAAGRPRSGHIILRAYHQGGQVNIEIGDDGRGIDVNKVTKKALEKGLITQVQAQAMSPKDATSLIFLPGFSTATTVTEVSGRGVGLDVVRTNVEKLGGQVEIESTVGEGTTFLLRLPLTLAIIPALMVGVGGQKFAVPQMNLVELVRVKPDEARDRIQRINHRTVLRLRGQLLPLVRLADVLGLERTYSDPTRQARSDRRQSIIDRRKAILVKAAAENVRRRRDRRVNTEFRVLVVQVGASRFGLIVDELFDSGEVVVKPLSAFAGSSGCFAGSTVTGDGRVILILDVGGLADRAKLGEAQTDLAKANDSPIEQDSTAGNRQSIILFNHGSDQLLAVPQERLLRLERTRPDQIERLGDKEFIQYQGAALPVLRLDGFLPVCPLAADSTEYFLLIPKRQGAGKKLAGILVSKIVDAMDVNVTVQPTTVQGPGIRGTAVVNGKLALFLDPEQLLDSVYLEDCA